MNLQTDNLPNTINDEEHNAESIALKLVDNISEKCFNLNWIFDYDMVDVEKSLENINILEDKLTSIREQSQESRHLIETCNNVDVFIDSKHFPWSWDNQDVHYYRATARDRDHQFQKCHFPEYFSTAPLPQIKNGCTRTIACRILCPQNGSSTKPFYTTILMNEEQLVGDLITKTLKKCHLDRKECPYILKTLGFAQYMDPTKKLFNYEFIRLKMREGVHIINLVLMEKTPSPTHEKQFSIDVQKKYTSLLDDKNYMVPINEKTYQNIPNVHWNKMNYTTMAQVNTPLKFRIHGLENVNLYTLPLLVRYQCTIIQLEMFLFYGTKVFENSRFKTREIPMSLYPRWMQWFPVASEGKINISNLPRDVRLGFILHGRIQNQEHMYPLSYYVLQLVDCTGKLTTGLQSFKMWPFSSINKHRRNQHRRNQHQNNLNFIFRTTNRENLHAKETVVLRVYFADYNVSIVAPLMEISQTPNSKIVGEEIKEISNDESVILEEIKNIYPLIKLKKNDYELVWKFRHRLCHLPHMLPYFLQSVQWENPNFKFEAHNLLDKWEQQHSIAHLLELLDVRFPDYYVRKYAVKKLQQLKDEELQFYLFQLTQCLKFEPYHDSPLSRFLIARALQNPHGVGHYFFWHLKTEIHFSPTFLERYAIILDEYLSHCGRHAKNLRIQNNAVIKIQSISSSLIKLMKMHENDDIIMSEYVKQLNKLNTFFKSIGKFQIPLDPTWEATTLIVNKCHYNNRKPLSLWLTFNNVDQNGDPHIIMFKNGEDLRQHTVALQLLRVIDRLWLMQGLDMKLKQYKCVVTGINDNAECVGMVEVILNSQTISDLVFKYYGNQYWAATDDSIERFLKENNLNDYESARDTFIVSCAGYCVAGYVLGIGHVLNENIMITMDGHLFFVNQNFLGTRRRKFGIKRRRKHFFISFEMGEVMGGNKHKKNSFFLKYLECCYQAFDILRKHVLIFHQAFSSLVSARFPSLIGEDNLLYLKKIFFLDISDDKAKKKFTSEIYASFRDVFIRRFDSYIHNFKHR